MLLRGNLARSKSAHAETGRVPFCPCRPSPQDVDLFSKDFIFVPVHEALHWSLMVVCHPGALPCYPAQLAGHLPMAGMHWALRSATCGKTCSPDKAALWACSVWE